LYLYLYIFLKQLLKEVNLFLVISSLVTLGLILFGLYNDFNGSPLSRETHIIYQATSRIIWSIGLAGIIYSCLNSGGIINDILSWKIWIPLSRLSFSAYLVHLTFIY
jgi:peptidoglycan/LPS O-acetylase OafA/YrhL